MNPWFLVNRTLTLATHRISNLPVIVLMPHSRCNCRCVMCDIWKANANKKEITAEELEKHVHHFRKLGVKEIVFSGGEALMHSGLWNLCSLLRKEGIALTLLSTGLLLERHAAEVVKYFREVIISVDGSAEVHDRIRNIPNGFQKLTQGIAALRKVKPDFRITARCVLQRYNFNDFAATVAAAKAIGISQVSFLPADISTTAFNHEPGFSPERVHEIALSKNEAAEFEAMLEKSFVELSSDYESKFIAESPGKMRKIAAYYKAVNGIGDFVAPVCNAPWVSAVIESDGRVMPCFFHAPYGNIYDGDLAGILNSPAAIDFRRTLNVAENPICKKCVCSLKLGRTEMV